MPKGGPTIREWVLPLLKMPSLHVLYNVVTFPFFPYTKIYVVGLCYLITGSVFSLVGTFST